VFFGVFGFGVMDWPHSRHLDCVRNRRRLAMGFGDFDRLWRSRSFILADNAKRGPLPYYRPLRIRFVLPLAAARVLIRPSLALRRYAYVTSASIYFVGFLCAVSVWHFRIPLRVFDAAEFCERCGMADTVFLFHDVNRIRVAARFDIA
jgi:hypothetical protein